MDKSIERAATNEQLQTSCCHNGKLIPAFTVSSCFLWETKHFTEPSHVNFKCPSAAPGCSCAAPVNCSFCSPARVTLRRKLRQADKVTAAQVTGHRQRVPSFQLQTPSSHQGFKLTCYPRNICPSPNPRVS